MAIVVSYEGCRYLLSLMVRDEVPSDLVFKAHLFSNLLTPSLSTTLGDLTEATFAGYAVKDLTRDQWSAPANTDVGAMSIYGGDFLTWTPSAGSEDIWGWYVTNDLEDTLLWAEQFPAFIAAAPTVPVAVLPMLRIRNG